MLDIPPITTLPNFSIASEVMSAAERKTKSSVRSPEILAGNEYLLLEILVRLPAKSLMRFKRVSNQWFSLISDSNFSSRYALCRLNRQPEGLLTFYNQSKPVSFNTRLLKNYKFFPIEPVRVPDKVIPCLKFLSAPSNYVRILQCCNGLSLCRSTIKSGEYDSRVTHYVCNFATKQFKVLPSFPARVKRANHCIFLAWDPFLSQHYKVVCAYSKRNKKDARWQDEIEIYSSQSGTWSPTPVIHPAGKSLPCGSPTRISWNGWIIWPSSPWHEHKCWYFDTNSESMKTMKLPVLHRSNTYRGPQFIACGSRFYILDIDLRRQIKVYEMDRGCPEWLLKHTVDANEMDLRFPSVRSTPYELHIFTGLSANEEDDFLLVMRLGRDMIIQSLKHKCSKVIVSCNRRDSEPSFSELHQHYETLFRP